MKLGCFLLALTFLAVIQFSASQQCGTNVPVTLATASAVEDPNVPANVLDNNLATRWSGKGLGVYLTLDLGSLKQVCNVGVAWYKGDTRTNRYSLSVSSNGTTYNQVYSGNSSLTTAVQTVSFTAKSARYVRLTFNGNTAPTSSDWCSVTEVKVTATTPTNTTLVKPTSANTGVPAGTTLTVVNGDLTISTPGQVVDAVDVRGFVRITASNVVFKRSIVRGRSTTSNGAMINVASGTGVKLQNVEIAPTTPSVLIDGIWGSNYVATAMNIHGTVDGVKLGSNCRVEKSWIHDLTKFASDPNQGGGSSHNDGVQILSGNNGTVYGNNIQLTSSLNAAIQVTQDFGAVTNLLLDSNWFDGGGCTVNIAHKGGPTPFTGTTLNKNRFGRNSYFNCPILISLSTVFKGTGNVWDDTNQTVPIQQHN